MSKIKVAFNANGSLLGSTLEISKDSIDEFWVYKHKCKDGTEERYGIIQDLIDRKFFGVLI